MLLAAYATGITMVHFFAPWDMTGYALAVGFLLLLWVVTSRSHWAWLPLLGLLLFAGFFSAALELQPPTGRGHIAHFADASPGRFEGTVVSVERRVDGGSRLLVDMHQATTDQQPWPVTGKVLLSIRDGEPKARPGQVVCWRSSLRRPVCFGNPGEFDYPLSLAARGIHVTAFLAHAQELVTLVNHQRSETAPLENCRQRLASQIEGAVPSDVAGLLESLLLGMRGGIDEEQRQLLASSGIAHLFAISGLHFGLLALLLYQIGRWCYTRSTRLILWCPPQRILPVLLLLPLSAYLLLTGSAWSTRRAFLMLSMAALLYVRNRRTTPLALLCTAALGLLLLNPLALFQPGFQLSFSGVAGILAWLPSGQKALTRLPRTVRWPLLLMMTTAAATMATAPATLWHFHQFTPAGLLTNLAALPLIAWGSLPIGLLSLAVLPLSAALCDCGLLLASWALSLAVDAASNISEWPGMSAIPIFLTYSSLALLVGGLLLLLPLGWRPRHWLARSGVLAAALCASWLAQPQATEFQVVALSVGQGDATLLTVAGNRHYLVDGGGLPGSRIDPGEQLVAPALGRLGIQRLEGVVLSHNHPDHASGLTYIMRRFPVANVYLAGEIDALEPELQETLRLSGARIHRLVEGWTRLSDRPDAPLSLFVPAQHAPDINERSIAVFAAQRGQGVLLPADLGNSGLRQLQEAGIPAPVTLLKLPHHGSRHARPELYLAQFSPQAAFCSSGRGNPYGFPHRQTLDACSAAQVELFRTDQAGMLTFRVVDGHWQAESGRAL